MTWNRKRTRGESHSDMHRAATILQYNCCISYSLNFDSGAYRNGVYTVKGQTYLQGKLHEQLIRSGMTAEIFVEVRCTGYG